MDSADVVKRPMTHQSFQEKVHNILQDMKKGTPIASYIFVNTDGLVEDKDISDDVHGDTVGIMNATMFGASRTMNGELRKKLPRNITVNYLDGLTYISSIQDKYIVDESQKDKYYLAANLDDAEQLDDKLKSTILKAVSSIEDLIYKPQ